MEVTIWITSPITEHGDQVVSKRMGTYIASGANGLVIRAGNTYFMYPWSAMRSCEFEIPDSHEIALARHFAGGN